MLAVLGDLDMDQEQYKEALAIYDKAKAVLVQGRARLRTTWPFATRS
jgi:hypothetical protein